MPVFAKQDCFKGLMLHQRDFGQSSVLSSSDKYITVLGGAKSAADMAYACAKAGKSVSWVIRSPVVRPLFWVRRVEVLIRTLLNLGSLESWALSYRPTSLRRPGGPVFGMGPHSVIG